ncbi:MAG: flavodoxin family protein [Phycisphaerales bacterium]|nr:flavodoxin family protein [Phycisphaerales bacterium]
MLVLSVNGSPRRHGNTCQMLDRVCRILAKAGAHIDELHLEERELSPCGACMLCAEKQDGKCHGRVDDGNEIIARSQAADVILLGSPVYFGSLTPLIKAYMDRVGFVGRVNGNFLARKIGAAVVPARRAGKLFTFAELNMWFLINGMIVPGSSYWTVGQGREEGEIQQDAEALQTLDLLADNIKWLATKLV